MKQNAIKYSRLLRAAVCSLLLLYTGQSVKVSSTTRSCGMKAVRTLQSGILTISGIGNIDDYSKTFFVRWYNRRDEITEVVIQEDITKIGVLAFCECAALTGIQIPNSVTKIEDYAFMNCTSLYGVVPDFGEGNNQDIFGSDITSETRKPKTDATGKNKENEHWIGYEEKSWKKTNNRRTSQ